MEQYFDYKHTKQEIIQFIKANEGLANVETDVHEGDYIDINVEIFPTNQVITYCRVDIKKDKRAEGQALKIAAVLNDYLDDYGKIKS